ncbi:MAG: flagellar hook-basal body complex protein [Candidatus Eremiobacteraeota bacterium]|nr:flagellar hook-basal body complex protein [Candidatus Eremiobacteraeota bacterium]
MSVDPLNIAAGALEAYNTANSVTANNVANVATPGFQSSTVLFQNVMGTIAAGAGTIGGGVQIGSIAVNTQPGGFQPTGSPTDIATTGSGLFALQSPSGTVYTRAGNFTIDANGTLVDAANGYPVLGYNASGALSPIQVPPSTATQTVGTGFGPLLGPTSNPFFASSAGGNLNQNLYQSAASGGPATPVTMTGTIYDSLGNAHQVQFTFTPIPPSAGGVNPAIQTVNNSLGVPSAVGTEWQVSVTNANPMDPMVVPPNAGYVFFSSTGQYINTSSDITGQTNTYTGGAPNPAGTQGNVFSISNWGPGDNAQPATISVDYSNMSSLAGASDPSMTAQNGSAPGSLQTISISSNGIVTGSFSNGTLQPISQIALANFSNPNGLQPLGGNVLQATPASGSAQIGMAGTGSLGNVVSGGLNSSNVSLDGEFIKMIETQDAFDANAKIVGVSNKDIQTILNLG